MQLRAEFFGETATWAVVDENGLHIIDSRRRLYGGVGEREEKSRRIRKG
jgi:hypothetical protein